jgi:hypothetical protein
MDSLSRSFSATNASVLAFKRACSSDSLLNHRTSTVIPAASAATPAIIKPMGFAIIAAFNNHCAAVTTAVAAACMFMAIECAAVAAVMPFIMFVTVCTTWKAANPAAAAAI